MPSCRNQFKVAVFPCTDCSNFQGFMASVRLSVTEALRPNEFGGSNEPSKPFSIPNSWVGLSDDLLTETDSTSVCCIGVICSMTRDGKCFSSEPYPRSAMRVSETKGSTSHLISRNATASWTTPSSC
uniref:Uncharacterized protein n=1 Tax=Triticum urartu TaxID=4572 RepID=A0A8R7TRZ8_TRIUA